MDALKVAAPLLILGLIWALGLISERLNGVRGSRSLPTSDHREASALLASRPGLPHSSKERTTMNEAETRKVMERYQQIQPVDVASAGEALAWAIDKIDSIREDLRETREELRCRLCDRVISTNPWALSQHHQACYRRWAMKRSKRGRERQWLR